MTDGLPQGWQETDLQSVATSTGGGTPSKAEAKYWVSGDVPWVSPKDMKTFAIRASEDRVTKAALDRLPLVASDSVLVVVRSGILSRTLPVAVSKMPVTINQDMRAFIPGAGVSPTFLAWQLLAKQGEVLAACSKHGTTVASIESAALARFPLWLAPEGEQSRIVAKLEELLSDLDAGVAELKAASAKLAQYRRSLLKAAVEGALTADWRREHAGEGQSESGEALLQRILAERRARWEAHQRAKFEQQGKPPPKGWQSQYPEPVATDASKMKALPRGWVWATIDQVARVGTGVTPLRSKPAYYANGTIPWVTSGAVNAEVVREPTALLSETAMHECRLEMFPVGSLLVAMYGEGKTRGKCSELGIASTINQALAAIVLEPSAQACKPFVKTVLRHSYDLLRDQASGGVQPNLNLQLVKAIAVPLPPLAEQAVIADVLGGLVEGGDHQVEAIDIALRQSTAQRQNLLRAAFSGRLVPQDPADEPASALLERIGAAREVEAAKNVATPSRQSTRKRA